MKATRGNSDNPAASPNGERGRASWPQTGRAAILFRPVTPLHVGAAILLTAPLRRLCADRFPRTVLLMDFGITGPRFAASGLTDSCFDRLACLSPEVGSRVSLASAVPSVARLAAVVASTLPPEEPDAGVDSRVWFRDILLAAGLLATRATHAVVEAGAFPKEGGADAPPLAQSPFTRRGDIPASELMLARRLAARVERLLPGTSTFPVPLLSGYSLFRSLDGDGPMGNSPKGTLYITDSPDEVVRKVRSAKTDARPYLDPERELSPEITNLLLLLHALTEAPVIELIDRFAGRRYSELKTALGNAANAFLEPIRARRSELVASETDLAASIRRESGVLEEAASQIADALAHAPEAIAA